MPINYGPLIQADNRFRFWVSVFTFLISILFLLEGPPEKILQVILLLLSYSALYGMGEWAARKNQASAFLYFFLNAIDCVAVTVVVYLTGGIRSPLYFLYFVIVGVALSHGHWVSFTYEAVLSACLYAGLLLWQAQQEPISYFILSGQVALLVSLMGGLTFLLVVMMKDLKLRKKLLSRAQTTARIADVLSGSLSNSREWMKTISGLIDDEIRQDGFQCRISIHRGEQHFLPPSGGKMGMHVPIMVGESIFGTLTVNWNTQKAMSLEDHHFFTSIAKSLGLSLHRAKLWEDFQAQMEKIEASLRLNPRVALSTEVKPMSYDQRVVDDMLTMVRLERGKWELKKGPCDIVELFGQEIKKVNFELASKDLKFITDWDAETVAPILADDGKIRHAIANLLYFAVKASSVSGEVHVRVKQDLDQMLLSVRTEGGGFPEDQLNEIFEKYYRVGPLQELDPSDGFGLGLAIAQKIVQAHKGHIWVESPGPGLGSTFWLTLPIERVGEGVRS
ncbi:MAG: HAMP domain-containing histidine kinase [Elusimicrobia bacterium]|nr:HAMP domain-containing histidine kinase [Candidatus Obscuribacterium magneticum]